MTARLLLVRHGVTTWNREGRFQGHLDPPLDPIGIEQARLLGRSPGPGGGATDADRHVALTRASATADLLAAAMRDAGRAVEVESHEGLMEIGQGEWSGLTHAEIARDDPSATPPGVPAAASHATRR